MIGMLLGFALLASAITANKMVLTTIPPLPFVALRMTIAGAFLCALMYKRSGRLHITYLKQDAGRLLIAGLLTTCFPSLLKAYALALLPSWKAAFIGSLDPFVTALYSYILLDHRLSMRQCIGIACGFAGTMTLCLWDGPLISWVALTGIWLPELAALTAVLVLRYGWMVAQQLLKKERYHPAELNGLLMLGSGVILSLISFVHQPRWLTLIPWSGSTALGMAYTVAVGNMLAYTLYAHALKKHSANLVSLVGFSVPLFVSLYGVLILGETLSVGFYSATTLVAIGVWLFYGHETKT